MLGLNAGLSLGSGKFMVLFSKKARSTKERESAAIGVTRIGVVGIEDRPCAD